MPWQKNNPLDVTLCISKILSECSGKGIFWDAGIHECREIQASDCAEDEELRDGVCVKKPKPANCNAWEKNDSDDVTRCISKSLKECTGPYVFWDITYCRAIRESDCTED